METTATSPAGADRRPGYVRRLDAERQAAQRELAAVLDGLNELRAYLTSPKFAEHRYVNVEDVLLRLNETTYAGVLAAERVR